MAKVDLWFLNTIKIEAMLYDSDHKTSQHIVVEEGLELHVKVRQRPGLYIPGCTLKFCM